MKVCLIKPCIVSDAPGVRPGDVFETNQGYYLIGLGVAFEAIESKVAPEVIETREPAIENRDPVTKPVKRTKGKLP